MYFNHVTYSEINRVQNEIKMHRKTASKARGWQENKIQRVDEKHVKNIISPCSDTPTFFKIINQKYKYVI